MIWLMTGDGMRTRLSVDDIVGYLPEFVFESDPRPAREQFDERYTHGGGWHPYRQGDWEMNERGGLQYVRERGDPPLPAWVEARLRDEIIRVYEAGIVSVTQRDGSFEVARMD